MVNFATLGKLTREVKAEAGAQGIFVRSNRGRLSLADLICSRMEYPPRPVDQGVVAAYADVNAALRRRSGDSPLGTWVPLLALTRDLSTSNTAALVENTVSGDAEVSLLPTSEVVGGGATVISGLKRGSLSLPYLNGVTGGAEWVGEGDSAAATTTPAFELATLVPKTITMELIVSRRLLADTEIDLDGLLRREIANRLGAAIDSAALKGDGVKEPKGILGHSGLKVHSLGANGGAITFKDLVDVEFSVAAGAAGGLLTPRWLVSPKLAKKLRTTAKNDAYMLFEGADILGYPVAISSAMPEDLTKGSTTNCAALLFGDLSEFYVGFWGPAAVDLMVDAVTLATDGAVRVIARAEVGIAPRRMDAFCAIKDATVS
ncbi:phage major capsid protein [Comamonas sp. NLF-1-9]|uniref:phage major capsid protein n=1 Tax=Comamonas sp. NLF-1-9 TaxID=2853163 RepID=UPI001C497107|nr:phage major capsid protein [Comamonas sp. NLF-1-9]QXL83263.1 phage major capsid protein [Comamonas sp. NLF-1-9]